MSFPAIVVVEPSHMMPGILQSYAQHSSFTDVLSGGKPLVQLGDGDMFVYAKWLDMRGQIRVNQAAPQQIPSPSLQAGYISTATYMARVAYNFDIYDVQAAANYQIGLMNAYSLAARASHYQLMRLAALYGINPSNGEGLWNAPGTTAANWLADANSVTNMSMQDPGFIFQQWLNQFSLLLQRVLNIGQRPAKLVVLAPQRIVAFLDWNVVELTAFQRVGAGSNTVAGAIEAVAGMGGYQVEFGVDDTLEGAGNGGADAVLIVCPEIVKPTGSEPDTNAFGQLTNGNLATTLQLTNMAAPKEVITPIADASTNVVSDLRLSSGWAVRPEAVTCLSIQY